MGKRQSQTQVERDERRERVLAFAEARLRHEGIVFDALSFTPSSGADYDGLVVVWHLQRGRTVGVRLPDAA